MQRRLLAERRPRDQREPIGSPSTASATRCAGVVRTAALSRLWPTPEAMTAAPAQARYEWPGRAVRSWPAAMSRERERDRRDRVDRAQVRHKRHRRGAGGGPPPGTRRRSPRRSARARRRSARRRPRASRPPPAPPRSRPRRSRCLRARGTPRGRRPARRGAPRRSGSCTRAPPSRRRRERQRRDPRAEVDREQGAREHHEWPFARRDPCEARPLAPAHRGGSVAAIATRSAAIAIGGAGAAQRANGAPVEIAAIAIATCATARRFGGRCGPELPAAVALLRAGGAARAVRGVRADGAAHSVRGACVAHAASRRPRRVALLAPAELAAASGAVAGPSAFTWPPAAGPPRSRLGLGRPVVEHRERDRHRLLRARDHRLVGLDPLVGAEHLVLVGGVLVLERLDLLTALGQPLVALGDRSAACVRRSVSRSVVAWTAAARSASSRWIVSRADDRPRVSSSRSVVSSPRARSCSARRSRHRAGVLGVGRGLRLEGLAAGGDQRLLAVDLRRGQRLLAVDLRRGERLLVGGLRCGRAATAGPRARQSAPARGRPALRQALARGPRARRSAPARGPRAAAERLLAGRALLGQHLLVGRALVGQRLGVSRPRLRLGLRVRSLQLGERLGVARPQLLVGLGVARAQLALGPRVRSARPPRCSARCAVVASSSVRRATSSAAWCSAAFGAQSRLLRGQELLALLRRRSLRRGAARPPPLELVDRALKRSSPRPRCGPRRRRPVDQRAPDRARRTCHEDLHRAPRASSSRAAAR